MEYQPVASSTNNESLPPLSPTKLWLGILILVLTVIVFGGATFFLAPKLFPKQPSTSTEVASDPLPSPIKRDSGCDDFPSNLKSCTPYKCQFTHSFTGESLTREIIGLSGDKCTYTEEMPKNGKMECNFSGELRRASADYYQTTIQASLPKASGSDSTSETPIVPTYTIGNQKVENPFQLALTNGACKISGY